MSAASAVRPRRLFLASCISLIATSVAFAVVGAIMLALKEEFTLSNLQIGWIAGAGLWGFAVAQLLFAPFCDTLGMRRLMRLAFVSHLAGAVTLILAGGFTSLFIGALTIALGNGLVEAACNPLVAALYPDDKTVKLNQFHVWFPGGIVIGSVLAYALDRIGLDAWQLKIVLIVIPTLVYGWLMLREEFPPTEGVKAGVSMGEMFRATFATPLMLLMLACMAITASTELGPNRWITPVLESGGIPGILVLAWISGLMAVLRYKAGFAIHRLSPTGVLLASAAISCVGLLWLSYAETVAMAFASATVFAVGVCYFWPTMLGFVSERVPRSGALGLGLMGAVGTAVVGLVTTPWMGSIADRVGHDRLPTVETRALLREAADALPGPDVAAPPDLETAGLAVRAALEETTTADLPPITTANALRAIMSSGIEGDLADRAAAILGPADNYGGRASFRSLLPFTASLILVFGLLYGSDRRSDRGSGAASVAGEGH
ncbi:MAG: MFS transporter [Gemmatimonadetes bacterium]|nr:MFS transporter [Gemmatimonadota bacterium]